MRYEIANAVLLTSFRVRFNTKARLVSGLFTLETASQPVAVVGIMQMMTRRKLRYGKMNIQN